MHIEPKDAKRLYGEAKSIRSPHEHDMRMASAYCLPWDYSAWQSDGPATVQGMAGARRIMYDSTGVRSLPKYVAILQRIATPDGQRWHNLRPSDVALRSKTRVRDYFDQLNDLLFRYRYNPTAGFISASGEMYGSLGAYGNAPLYIGQRKPKTRSQQPGLRYKACPIRDVFFLTDDEGEIVIIFRRFWLNVRQFMVKFPGHALPKCMTQGVTGQTIPNENKYFEFVHIVTYRDQMEYDPKALDARRHPVVGVYLSVESEEYIGKETGYQSLPYKIPRTTTVAGNPYGYAPATQAMSALGGASTMKKTQLKQGQKAVDPVLLAHDDGVLNGEVDLRPGAINYGGVDSQGRKRIQALDTGDFRVSEVLIDNERKDIEDSFFVTLFQILTETPEMTATEVVERVAEKAALLAPTMGRLQTEFLGPLIEREIDILTELGVMPPMPPELIEARGEYEVVYTSPMAKGMYAEEVSGFMRAFEFAMSAANVTQDPSHLDHFELDVAIPEISDYMAVPARWLASEDRVKQKREDRSQQMQQQQLMQNAPALASAAKTASEMQGADNAG